MLANVDLAALMRSASCACAGAARHKANPNILIALIARHFLFTPHKTLCGAGPVCQNTVEINVNQ